MSLEVKGNIIGSLFHDYVQNSQKISALNTRNAQNNLLCKIVQCTVLDSVKVE